MRTTEVEPGALSGALRAIDSKSDAHRNLICAALADGPTAFDPFSLSDDIDATMACLQALGADIAPQADGGWIVTPGRPEGIPLLDCVESGSTLRFLLPVAAALCESSVFTGRGRLPERRVATLLGVLRDHGSVPDAERLPLTLSGRLRPGTFSIVGNESSQYISGLLFALPLLDADCAIEIVGPLSSRGYVDMTLATLRRFGVAVKETEEGFFLPGGQRYRSPGRARLQGDWSNSAFFLVSGALGTPVTITGLDPGTPQRDRRIADYLRLFGASVEIADGRVTAAPGELTGQRIDVDQTPDLLPVLSVLGCAAKGETLLYNAARLRDKESDRLATTAAMLRALGGEVEELPDALRITGVGRLRGGRVRGAGDHRIVMAAAAAAAICDGPVVIEGSEAVSKSYPGFFTDYMKLGGTAHVVELR